MVRERLGRRERLRRGKHIARLSAAEMGSADAVLGPVMMRAVGKAVPKIPEVGAAVKEVRCNQSDHVRFSAPIFTKIDDERAGAGDQRHRRRGRGSAKLHILERVEAHVADVPVQLLDLLESAVALVQVRSRRSGWSLPVWALRG